MTLNPFGFVGELPDGYPRMTDPVRCRCGSVYDLAAVTTRSV